MKVRYIKNDGYGAWITTGKTYNVIEEENNHYKIINDNGIESWFPQKLFKRLSEIRNETINKLLEDES